MLLMLLLGCGPTTPKDDSTGLANTAPDAALIAISPAAPTTTDDLVVTVQGGGADPEGDPVTMGIAWFRDGAEAGITAETVPADQTTRDEVWRVVVTPSDGVMEGPPAVAEVTILDTAPSAALVLDPIAPRTADAVTASVVTDDIDGDEVSVAWSWTRDGVAAGLVEPILPEGTTRRGEVWVATAVPTDGALEGEPATAGFTVGNAPPTLGGVTIVPDAPTVIDTLEAVASGGADLDGDALLIRLEWWVNDVAVATDEVPEGESALLSGVTTRGDRVRVRAVPFDGYDEGAPVDSVEVEIVDAPPSATGATILPSPLTTADDATCTGAGWADPDGDAEGWLTTWTVDGVVVSTDPILPAGSHLRGQTVGCTLVPDDGERTGTAVDATPVVVANASPVCTSASIAIGPDPATVADTLAVVADGYTSCTDADGDPLTLAYDWQVDAVSVGAGPTLSGVFLRGQSVRLSTTLTDGYVAAVPAISNTVIIVNAPPVVTGVVLAPATPLTADTVTTTVTTSDLEGDTLSLAYSWTVDGVPTGAGESLTGDDFSRGQLVAVDVTAFDGTDWSAPVTASVTIGNSPPGAPLIDITPGQVEDGDDLVCVVTTPATDPDGDGLTTTIAWTVDGTPSTVATTTTLDGDTIPASATTLGQVWVCTVHTTDGTDAGPSVEATAVVGCDEDGDGYADATCGGDDCDDTDAAIHPGAAELCEVGDEDCDGLEGDADPSVVGTIWYHDADADTYGVEMDTLLACGQPDGYESRAGDCDDTNRAVNPYATERCDARDVDEDCDGLVNDADPSVTGRGTFYVDADGDGYGEEGSVGILACAGLAGYAATADDCNDIDATVSPGAPEVCNDGIDNDCGGAVTECGILGDLTAADAGFSISSTSAVTFPTAVAWGDWNGDGTVDLAAGTQVGDWLGMWFGPMGAGTAAELQGVTDDDARYSGVEGLGYLLSGVGDVDADGYDDLIAQTYPDAWQFLLSGGPTPTDTVLSTADALERLGYWSPVTPGGDFDADGIDDYFVGTRQYISGHMEWYLELWRGDPSGPALATTWGPGTYDIGGTGAGDRDWDGDGIDDLLVSVEDSPSTPTDGFAFLAGEAAPLGTALASGDLWASGLQYGGVAAAGDVDDDGHEDAVFIDYGADRAYIFLGPPTTGLGTGDAWATAPGDVLTVGDTDADGFEELYVGTASLLRRYDFPLSSGGLSGESATVTFGTAGTTVVGAVAGPDFSADGYGDLLLAYYGSGTDYLRIFEGGAE